MLEGWQSPFHEDRSAHVFDELVGLKLIPLASRLGKESTFLLQLSSFYFIFLVYADRRILLMQSPKKTSLKEVKTHFGNLLVLVAAFCIIFRSPTNPENGPLVGPTIPTPNQKKVLEANGATSR